MKTKFILFPVCEVVAQFAVGQSQPPDTLVLLDQNIIGRVKEVTPELVAYQLPDNTVLYKIRRTQIKSIKYGSGRVEKSVLVKVPVMTDPKDWQDVIIVASPDDLQGVHKIDDIYVMASFNRERTKNALKMAAAMVGGNVLQTTGVREFHSTRTYSTPVYSGRYPTYVGNSYSTPYFQSTATVYTTQLPDTAAFLKLVKSNLLLCPTSLMKLGRRSNHLSFSLLEVPPFSISGFMFENGNIFVIQKMPGIGTTKFHVNYFDEKSIVLSYRSRWGFKYYTLGFFIRPIRLKN